MARRTNPFPTPTLADRTAGFEHLNTDVDPDDKTEEVVRAAADHGVLIRDGEDPNALPVRAGPRDRAPVVTDRSKPKKRGRSSASKSKSKSKSKSRKRSRMHPTPLEEISERVVKHFAPGALLQEAHLVEDRDGFARNWSVTGRSAAQHKNLTMVAIASVLCDAAVRVTPGALVECLIHWDDATWDVWVDGERSVLLAVVHRPDLE